MSTRHSSNIPDLVFLCGAVALDLIVIAIALSPLILTPATSAQQISNDLARTIVGLGFVFPPTLAAIAIFRGLESTTLKLLSVWLLLVVIVDFHIPLWEHTIAAGIRHAAYVSGSFSLTALAILGLLIRRR